MRELGSGIHRAVLCYGFMEKPDVSHDTGGLASHGIPVDPVHTSFFIGHNNVVSGEHPLLPSWQRRLFLMLSRFAASPTDFLGLPANRDRRAGQPDRGLTSQALPRMTGEGTGAGEPQERCLKISDLKFSEIICDACPLPTLPRMTGEEMREKEIKHQTR